MGHTYRRARESLSNGQRCICECCECNCSTKHAYVVFLDKQTADAIVESANAQPVELAGRQLLIHHYTEPPNHVPDGKPYFSVFRSKSL